MGCTTSAPNTVPINTNATDKTVEINEAAVQTVNGDIEENFPNEDSGINKIKVLPSCDTLAEPIELDSNNKSMIDKSTLDMEKDLPKNGIVIKGDDSVIEEQNSQNGIKLSSLEDVVEKVVELYVADNLFASNNIHTDSDLEQNLLTDQKENSEHRKDKNIDKPPDETEDANVGSADVHEDELPEEATSPSQSTSSRATRWEALADIAAELPPSLAVDPLTGQIYALTK